MQTVKSKVRFVVRGNQEKYPQTKDDVYSPVSDIHKLRVILSLAVQRQWQFQQADVSTAFLNATVDHDIYLRLPAGVAAELESEGLP